MVVKCNKKKILEYVILFIAIFFWNLVIQPLNGDELWNYGFAYGIANGLIPYKDFNMVVTPLYSFIAAIPMVIFNNNVIGVQLLNSFVLLGLFYLLEKLFKDNNYVIFTYLLLGAGAISPGYNILLVTLYTLLIFFEKEKKNDFLIGLIIGLCFLTKQSVGVCLILPSLYFIKNKKKIIKRFIGFLLPCLIFLVYLLIVGSLFDFLDLCLFGLFDFASSNGDVISVGFIVFILLFLFIIYRIRKDSDKLFAFYTLAFSSVAIPLFDTLHLYLWGFALVMYLFFIDGVKVRVNNKLLFCGAYISIGVFLLISNGHITYPNSINHFQYRLINDGFAGITDKISVYISEHEYEYVFLGSQAHYFKMVNDMNIDYLDLINYGNSGYGGTKKTIEMIKEKDDNTVFIIDCREINSNSQVDKEVLRYVMENAKKIDEIGVFHVYRFV